MLEGKDAYILQDCKKHDQFEKLIGDFLKTQIYTYHKPEILLLSIYFKNEYIHTELYKNMYRNSSRIYLGWKQPRIPINKWMDFAQL